MDEMEKICLLNILNTFELDFYLGNCHETSKFVKLINILK